MNGSAILYGAILFLFISCIQLCTGQTHLAPAYVFDDAVTLTLRLQGGIDLDTALERKVSEALASARTTHDTLKTIHALAEYVPDELIVSSNASWTEEWRKGNVTTGYRPVDSINTLYGLVEVEQLSIHPVYVLRFDRPLKMDLLTKEYAKINGIGGSEPNGTVGDGDRIELLRKNGSWHFVFSHGWGDCPAGCVHRDYWYVTVNSASHAKIEETRPDSSRYQPVVYTWNIPDLYPATAFVSWNDLVAALSSSDWWVRRHAVTVLDRLSEWDTPWTGIDLDNRGLFEILKNTIRQNKSTVLTELRRLLNDPDQDVRVSVRQALATILGYQSAAQTYFPLKVGNYWEFRVRFAPVTEQESIIDSSTTGHDMWYVFDSFRHMKNAALRMTQDGKLHVKLDTLEQVWIDFGAGTGKSWKVFGPGGGNDYWTVTLESTDDTLTVPAGFFRDVYRFRFRYNGADNDWIEYYAPMTGPVKRTLNGFGVIDYELVSFLPGDTVTAVDPVSITLPSGFSVRSLYPNPASGSVSTDVRVDAHLLDLSITVYDALGRLVTRETYRELVTGTHSFNLDIPSGGSGMYIVRFQSGEYSTVRTLPVLR